MRTSTTYDLADNIVRECHAQFDKLPKNGKPANRNNGQAEWTILAGIVMATPVKDHHATTLSGTKNNEQSFQTEALWEIECISLATGSKCLPQGKQSPRGDLLNDCHAEVLARRGFNKWCLHEMQKSVQECNNLKKNFNYLGAPSHDVQQENSPLFELTNAGTQFHLYVSQAPCGDATTASLALTQSEESRNAFMAGQQRRPKSVAQEPTAPGDQDLSTSPVTGSKHARESEALVEPTETSAPSTKLQKCGSTSTTATAKSHTTNKSGVQKDQQLVCSDQVLGFRRGRIDYDSVGVLRTKPGRVDSEPTLSMSCSDKITRWNILGLNSALVMPFLKKPIYLESVVTKELFDAEALERALFRRIQGCRRRTDHTASPRTDEASTTSTTIHPREISVHKSEIAFEFGKEAVSKQSEQEGITSPPVACASTSEPQLTEVLINGCKAGASVKKQIQPKSRSRLCKINMFESSVTLWKSISPQPPLVQSMMSKTDAGSASEPGPTSITYHEWKRLNTDFTKAKQLLFAGVFQNWVRGDASLESFNIHGGTISDHSNQR
ncbi:tRNA-specific adenosine deaminase 1 [Mortierella hygrophila]|uniref:tRNA-specific adenosine deaminase 1 n=1 Tax=Mortierella hygrophila TaxID=979708 RepID=A0A9P6F5E5_9FUNG|nr:tRNA-specific adenosine deaminase 1 [Mortierella hygrophila]